MSGQGAAPAPLNLHASVVAFGARNGVMITGPSGSGKSQLALALIEAGAKLVTDDQAITMVCDGQLFVRPPRPIAGLIEARGIGLLQLPYHPLAQIAWIVDLGLASAPRLPQPAWRRVQGIELPVLAGRPDPSFAMSLARRCRSRRMD